MSEQNFLENQIIILTKQTLDVFLKQKNPVELIGVYSFYYYTAKWQKTNQIKCTTNYVSQGLGISETKVRAVKKQLIELGLIEDVQTKDENNRITGHYIKINYVFKKETIEKIQPPSQNPTGWNNAECGTMQSVENQQTNALSADTLNALSSVNSNALSVNTSNAKKKERKKSSYDDILSAVSDESLRETYYEFIKMRKLIKAPMTDRALKMLIDKVEKLEPNSIERQKQILDTSIMNNWKSVYPLKDNNRGDNNGQNDGNNAEVEQPAWAGIWVN